MDEGFEAWLQRYVAKKPLTKKLNLTRIDLQAAWRASRRAAMRRVLRCVLNVLTASITGQATIIDAPQSAAPLQRRWEIDQS